MNIFNSLFFLCILFYSLFEGVIGQTYSTTISGDVTDTPTDRSIPNIEIVLLENQDTLEVTKTDSLGKFKFFVTVSPQKDYILKIDCYSHSDLGHTIDIVPKKEGVEYEYIIETSCFYYNERSNSLQSAYYELNETKTFNGFNVEQLYNLMQEDPQMCLKALPFHIASENEKIVNKRIRNFKDALLKSNIDLNRIAFGSPKVIENNSEELDKQQSIIYFEVFSMDGNCKN